MVKFLLFFLSPFSKRDIAPIVVAKSTTIELIMDYNQTKLGENTKILVASKIVVKTCCEIKLSYPCGSLKVFSNSELGVSLKSCRLLMP